MPKPDKNGPSFGQAASHISDVQLRHTLSPDNQANTILFDNFALRLLPGGPPIVSRTLSVVFPLTKVSAETPLTLQLRGDVSLLDGARATLVYRVLGETHVLDPLLAANGSHADYSKELNLTVRPGDDLAMTFLIALDRDAAHPSAEGLLTVDSVDMALGPGKA